MALAEFSVPRLRIAERGNRLLRWTRANWALVLVTLLATVPVVVAFSRAALHGWWPEGDDAVIGLKVQDIFGGHPPVMGMRSTTGSVNPALAAHHPGPLEFYLLALPSALTGFHPIGLLVGTAAIGVVTLVAVSLVAHRRGGLLLTMPVLAGALAVQWAVGPEVLFRPLNPYPAVLPVLLLLLLTWSLLVGDLACMWGYALTASFVAQAHLAYLPVVLALTALLAAVGVFRWYERRHAIWPLPGWRPLRRPGTARPGRRAIVVLALCWLPVVVETLRFDPDNLAQLMRYATSDRQGDGIGWGTAASLVTGELAPIPGGFSALTQDNGPLYHGTSALAQVLGVCLVGALLFIAVQWRRLPLPAVTARAIATASAVALYALVATCATVALIPISGLTPRYFIIGLWPAVAFAWAVLGWTVAEMARVRLSAQDRPALLPVQAYSMGASLILLAMAAVLACFSPVGLSWTNTDRAKAASDALAARLSKTADSGGTVRIEAGGWVGWGSLSSAIAYRLEHDGHRAYVPSLWPYPQDDDFRKLDAAPPGATRILIRERVGSTSYGPDPGAGVSPVVALPLGKDGRVEVFVDPAGP